MDVELVGTPIGPLKILSINGFVHEVSFIDTIEDATCQDYSLIYDLADYFSGASTKLLSNYVSKGTPFQKKVWKEISKIPYGSTKTYSQIAEAIGSPTACRAVANACGQNKVALFVPCHRVVGKNNKGGFRWGIERKKWLLDLEKKHSG